MKLEWNFRFNNSWKSESSDNFFLSTEKTSYYPPSTCTIIVRPIWRECQALMALWVGFFSEFLGAEHILPYSHFSRALDFKNSFSVEKKTVLVFGYPILNQHIAARGLDKKGVIRHSDFTSYASDFYHILGAIFQIVTTKRHSIWEVCY